MNQEIIHTDTCFVRVKLSEESIRKVLKKINLSKLGKEDVNGYDNSGKMISVITLEDENKVREAHYNIHRAVEKAITFDITDDGNFVNYRIEN